MRRELPTMASFAELVRIAARAATHQVVEGSRRNARTAVQRREEELRHGSEVLATLPVRATRNVAGGQHQHRPSA